MIALIFLFLLISISLINGGEFVPPKPPNFEELEKMDASTIDQDPAFIAAVKESAGYYKDPKRNPALSETIVMAGVNNGYKDFFHNFKCFMDRLNIKFLPISLDEGIYSYITNYNVCILSLYYILYSFFIHFSCFI